MVFWGGFVEIGDFRGISRFLGIFKTDGSFDPYIRTCLGGRRHFRTGIVIGHSRIGRGLPVLKTVMLSESSYKLVAKGR